MEGTHDAIIDRETFQAVQKLMALRSREDGTGLVHPLAGAGEVHGLPASTMSKTSNGKKGPKRVCYLRCKLYADSGGGKTVHPPFHSAGPAESTWYWIGCGTMFRTTIP